MEMDRGSHSLRGSSSGAQGLGPVEEPASGGHRIGGTAAKTGLRKWVGAPTATGAHLSGAPGQGPVGDQPVVGTGLEELLPGLDCGSE